MLSMPVRRAASVSRVSASRNVLELRKSVVLAHCWMPGSAACSTRRWSSVSLLSGELTAICIAPNAISNAPGACGRASSSLGSISAIN